MTWKWFHTVATIAITLSILSMVNSSTFYNNRLMTAWRITAFLILTLMIIVGHGITGRMFGVLIDERNRMSLSRLQLIVWTILLLSAYLTTVLWNVSRHAVDPLMVSLPKELWWLMGISTASLVGTPLILSNKKLKTAEAGEKARTENLLTVQKQIAGNEIETQGQVIIFKGPEIASLADLFKGDDTGNAAQVDLSKVQMFLFTMVIALSYSASLAGMFVSVLRPINQFPPLSESIIALLGISHAGYLSFKSVPAAT